jgi:6,7-dimethyl-8-ribityllumazine synthase
MAGSKIAFIQGGWHTDITDHCKSGFMEELARRGVAAAEVEFFIVPGSLEIPLMAKRLASTGAYSAVCCSGFVVDGGIYRHDFVATAVLSGIMQVGLETGVPVLSAVLTPHEFREEAPHIEFFSNHMVIKGQELASACVAMREALASVR